MPLPPSIWIPSPDQVLGWLLRVVEWLLAQTPASLGYIAYMVLLVALTRWTARHVHPRVPDPYHPMFQQPGGGLGWVMVGGFRLLLILGAGLTAGLAIPGLIGDVMWHNQNIWPSDPLGALGRLSELVGLVCGVVIGYRCQYQLNVLVLIAIVIGAMDHLSHWALGG